MKTVIGIFLLSGFLCLPALVCPAHAEQINIGDMLCSELTVLQLEEPNRVKEMMAWFDGYFGASANELIYNIDDDNAHEEKILAYCREHPLSYVMQAASQYFH